MSHLAPLSQDNTNPADLNRFAAVFTGHQAFYINDLLHQLISQTGQLSLSDLSIWQHLMIQARCQKSLLIRIQHYQLMRAVSLSESGLRGVLARLVDKGFLIVIDKVIDPRKGKRYVFQITVPLMILAQLQKRLAESKVSTQPKARKKETSAAKPASGQASQSRIHSIPTDCTWTLPLNEAKALKASQQEQVYLSRTAEIVPKTAAWIRQDSPPNPLWTDYRRFEHQAPSQTELKMVLTSMPQNPTEQALQAAVSYWGICLERDFLKTIEARYPSKSRFMRALIQHQAEFDAEKQAYFAAHLPKDLPEATTALLNRIQEFRSNSASPYFEYTLPQLEEAYANWQAKQGQTQLRPDLVLSLPRYWVERLQSVVKHFALSKEALVPLAYHLTQYRSKKRFDSEAKRWEYNLCLAVSLLQQGRWSCPKGYRQAIKASAEAHCM